MPELATPIGNKKPVVIRSVFLNEQTYTDDLKIADKLEALFRTDIEQGVDSDLIYVDVSKHPKA